MLNMDMEALVDFEANYKNATHTFGEVLPFAEALVKVADDEYAFRLQNQAEVETASSSA